MKQIAYVLILIFVVNSTVFPDTIEMTNGDRLTGKIVKKEGDKLFIETEIAGTISVKWSMVKEIVSENKVVVTLDDGKKIEGKIKPIENKIEVKGEAEAVEVKPEQVRIVRTPEAQAKYEDLQRRIAENGILDFWSGTVDVGFSLTSGNSDTRTFSAAMRATRKRPKNTIRTYANAVQVRDTSSDESRIRAQSMWAGVKYESDINKKLFAYASTDLEYNKPQELNIRAVIGGGLGYRALRNERIQFDVSAGFTNNYENFSTGLKRNSAEASIGEDFKIRINERVRFTERFVFYPNLTNFGEARALLDASLETDINSWLGWQLSIGNRFNSQPVNQTETNDFILSTGLRFSFGNKRKKLP